MKTHQKLTAIGAALLLATLLIDQYHRDSDPTGTGFNYAYVTGMGMLAAFSVSLLMFTKAHLRS